MLIKLLLVAAGGALGSVLRYLVGAFVQTQYTLTFPYHTLGINVLGCFVMGLLIGWGVHAGGEQGLGLRLFLITGVLGGFTTFSAFSLDVVMLVERGAYLAAATYIAASLLASLFAVFSGLWLVEAMA